MASPGLFCLAIKFAQARPNTTKSNNELAPRRFAPWTDAHAVSPAAHKPGTICSAPSLRVSTCNNKIHHFFPPVIKGKLPLSNYEKL